MARVQIQSFETTGSNGQVFVRDNSTLGGAWTANPSGVTLAQLDPILDGYQPLATVLTNTTASFTTADETKLDYITVTQAVNLDTMESDIATNNAKVTNATHTGEVTGATTLTLGSTAITNKTIITTTTFDSSDLLLIADASDSNNLKRTTIATATMLGGWTNVILGSDFTTSGTANVNVTGLSFAPSRDVSYIIRGYFLLRTDVTTTGARPGLAWASNLLDGASSIFAPSSNTASAQRWQGAQTTQNAASTGLPTTTDSYLAILDGFIIGGPSTSGSMQVTLASETADATLVTMRAGSVLSYQRIA